MVVPTLSTKFYIPRPRKNLVRRQRLFDRLNEGLHRKLILVSAPAGYGKTTLLASWLADQHLPVAWISADAGDNDFYRFFSCLLEALRQKGLQIGEALLQMLGSANPPSQASLVTLFLNEVSTLPDDYFLVIDDFHVIDNVAIHAAFHQIILESTRQLHFILCSRTEPPFSVSRLRSHYDLLELSQKEFSLTLDESALYLNMVMGLGLKPHDIAILQDRTEGWLTGMQLAALSLRDQEDPTGFIRSLKGDNRFIADYLVDEVLAHIPEDLQEFLLCTSVLSQMEASLCNFILQIINSQELLEALDKKRLFIIPLDENRRWFRYHHLFGEMLQDRLVRKSPGIVSGLYQRASIWYARHGMKEEAVEYALAAGDFNQAADIIIEIGQKILSTGGWNRLLSWYHQIPWQEFLRHDKLWLVYFTTLINAGMITTAVQKIGEIHIEELEPNQLSAEELVQTKGELASIQGVLDLHSKADPALAGKSLKAACESLTRQAEFSLNFAALNYGITRLLQGEIEEARLILEESTAWWKKEDISLGKVMGTSYLAEILAMKGDLDSAHELFINAERYAREGGVQEGAVFSKANLGLGALYYEWNQLDLASQYLNRGIQLAEQGGYLDQLLPGYAILARIQYLQNDLAGAQETIRRANRMSDKYGDPPQAISFIEAVKADLARLRGDLVVADSWSATCKFPPSTRIDLYSQYEQVVLARILATKGDNLSTVTVLQPLREIAERQGRVRDIILLDVIASKCLFMSGEPAEAIEVMQQAIAEAEPCQFVRTILDEGGVVISMIKQLLAAEEAQPPDGRNISPEYLRFLLDEAAKDSLNSAALQHLTSNADGLEPLTDRELHVLHLLEAGYSNKQIAQEMTVSLNTVKYHLKNIYGKLGVINRTQAARIIRNKGQIE